MAIVGIKLLKSNFGFMTGMWNKNFLILASLILIGILVRVAFALPQGFFYDEGIWLYKALALSRGDVLYQDLGDNRPPLFHYLLSLFIRLPGFGADVHTLMVVRVILGALWAFAGLFIYRMGAMMYGQWVGILAMGLWMIEPQLIVQSVQVEGETFALLLVVIGYYFLVKGENKHEPQLRQYLLSGLFFSAGLITHWFVVVSIFPAGVYFLVSRARPYRSWKSFRDNFLIPVRSLAIGALGPVIAVVALLMAIGSAGLFAGAITDASTTVDALGLSQGRKPQYLQDAFRHFSLGMLWALAGVEFVISLSTRGLRYLLLPAWFVGTILLIYYLPQSPGEPTNYFLAYPAMVVLAASAILVIVNLPQRINTQRRTVIGIQALVVIVFLGFAIWNYSALLPHLGDPARRLAITTESLDDQVNIASYLRENTNPDDRILTFTTTYTFLSDREAVNHFTFGTGMPSIELMQQSLIDGNIEYVLMDPRTEYRLNQLFPSQPMENLLFNAYLNLESPESVALDGMNIIFADEQKRLLNLWVHSSAWVLPKNSDAMAHFEQVVRPGTWTNIEFDVSKAFQQEFGSFPRRVTLEIAANGNGGSSINARMDWVTLRNGDETIFVDDFEIVRPYLWNVNEEDVGVSSSPGEMIVAADNQNRTFRARSSFGLGPYHTVRMYYEPQKEFTIKRHKSQAEFAPVTLWRYTGPPKSVEVIACKGAPCDQ